MSWSKYSKRYKKDWENLPEFKNWLTGENDVAHCKVCKIDLRPQLADLKRHVQSQKHTKNVRAKAFQPSLKDLKPPEDLQSTKKR